MSATTGTPPRADGNSHASCTPRLALNPLERDTVAPGLAVREHRDLEEQPGFLRQLGHATSERPLAPPGDVERNRRGRAWRPRSERYGEADMDLHLKDPDLQAKVERWTAETGRSADELAEDAIAGYLESLAEERATLDSRYDDLKAGRVKPIDGEAVFARLRAKSDARRHGEA
jgi:hypothetical protein